MQLHATWFDYALRLALTVVAGVLIGLNRESSGHPAGLRTTTLVALAAAVAMIQANLIVPLAGKAANGFVNLDAMRLPLGILTGMGFIGGGAILRRGSLVIGVTTAATLWATTVIGLCFGGGQLVLGAAGTALILAVLWGLKPIDRMLPKLERATLCLDVTAAAAGLVIDAERLGVKSVILLDRAWKEGGRVTSTYEVSYPSHKAAPIEAVERLAHEPGVLEAALNCVTAE